MGGAFKNIESWERSLGGVTQKEKQRKGTMTQCEGDVSKQTRYCWGWRLGGRGGGPGRNGPCLGRLPVLWSGKRGGRRTTFIVTNFPNYGLT